MKPRLALVAALLAGLLAPAEAQWRMAPGPMRTRWAGEVSPQNVWREYPRPQMARARWQSLNGLWSYGLSDLASTTFPADMSGKILVPFPFESALSGVGGPSPVAQKLWYRRTFSVSPEWKEQNVLLHFGAVNYEATVALNGQVLETHRGGFDSFDFDISSALQPGQNELVVVASNPLKADVFDAQVLGKQRARPGGIFYTGATGIWQSVWLEPVPLTHIKQLRLKPDIDQGALSVNVGLSGGADVTSVRVEAFDAGTPIARIEQPIAARETQESPFVEIAVPLSNPKLWSPESPFLYDLKVTLLNGEEEGDSVRSYFGMRKISLVKDERGRTVFGLNNAPYFGVGVLDQGYWPDGIFTAPSDQALKFDIQSAKSLGFNILRKHAKVEPARWYFHADKIGVLVWQDMPQMFGARDGDLTSGHLSEGAKAGFESEWRRILAQHFNSPSIAVWTPFNEGWGQHNTERITALTKQLDPSRLVNSTSGWVDKGVGDMHDTHSYPEPASNAPEPKRAAVNGEFGGVALSVPGHRWNTDVFGYGQALRNPWQLAARYQQLFKNAYALKDERGTSAFVYTQLTDVEQEINGLLTYDRQMKADTRLISAANRGQFLPLPPDPDVVPTSEIEPQSWQYTLSQPAGDWLGSLQSENTRWQTGEAPFGQGMSGVRTSWTTPDIWMRRAFSLPSPLPRGLVLLVKHDEDAQIYINGVLAASVTGYNDEYTPVPLSQAARASLKPGQNLMAVHVHQTVGGQGIDVGIAQSTIPGAR